MKRFLLAVVLAFASVCVSAAPTTEVMFFFDAEDYTSDRPNDALRDLANLFTEEGARVHVAMVGYLAHQLERYGRKDVIAALKPHLIGTQSAYHSKHPNVLELSDGADYGAAYERVRAEEEEGVRTIERVVGRRPFFAVPPGNSKSYVAMDVYADLGLKFYCDTVCEEKDGGNWFANLRHFDYGVSMEALIPRSDETRKDVDWKALLDRVASRPRQLLFLHPCMAVNRQFWDGVNYNRTNACEFGRWKLPARRAPADTQLYYTRLREFLRRLKADGRFTFPTLDDKLPAPRAAIVREDVARLAVHMDRAIDAVPDPSWCVADVFAAAVKLLRGEERHVPGVVHGFLEKPFAIDSSVTLKVADLRKAAAEIRLEAFLPAVIPVGGVKIGPGDFLRAALHALADGGETVTVAPSDPLAGLSHFPLLREFKPAGTWVFWPAFTDGYTSDRLRWQVWTWRPERTVESATILDAVRLVDESVDREIGTIADAGALKAKQSEWRAKWLAGIGGLPTEKTPLNAKEGPVVKCDGFTLQNVLFESLPGVYVVGHLCLPDGPDFKPPYPVVMMPLGHSNEGILAPRYAAHLARMARAGFAAFAWDPISQGERRQCAKKFDGRFQECAAEHTRLGARGWLVGWNFARFRLWDAIRAVDYVETRKDLDCSKLGACGTSGGGTMSAYMQALDHRIKVAFPNCYISSFREVFACRGCHDSEQFYFNQLNDGVNHAAMLAMGLGRVALATGSRYDDYFPHPGAVSTFAVYSNLYARLNLQSSTFNLQPSTFFPWHFHCAGPHGLPPPTRAAQTDWMIHCIKGGAAPKPLAAYQALGGTNPRGLAGNGVAADPTNAEPLPYATNDTYAANGFVRDLPGFRSVYALIAERAEKLCAARRSASPKSRERLREIVRRRAGIRPLAELVKRPREDLEPFDHPTFGWWYLKGPYGYERENEAAMMATLGRSMVGREAERMILKRNEELKNRSTFDVQPSTLRSSGWDCIAAAHAYAAEPQLWSGVEFTDPPPSWTEMVLNPDPTTDSYAVAVWGALEEYDWTDLIKEAK